MADQKGRSLKTPEGKDQNDDENRNPEQQSRDTSHPPSAHASATPVSNNETHTPMDRDTTDRKTRDQPYRHVTSTDVDRRENRTSCQDVQAHTSGDVVGTETHTSVQSQETSFRDSENQLVETRTATQVGGKNTIINKTINTYKGNHNHTHVHNHFHYSCPPPPHHHGDSSSSYHVPCPNCLHYHDNDHPPLAETHRPQPESEPRHLGFPPPVPQLPPGPQQTQHTESSQRRVAQTSESAETRRVCNKGVRDTLCILDSKGQALKPGDALWMGSQFGIGAVYVGNQQFVYCPGKSKMVVKKKLVMTSPFGKLTVKRKSTVKFNPPGRDQTEPRPR